MMRAHTWIRIQRGICRLCNQTVTMLPGWLVPGGHYSLAARQQAAQLATAQNRAIEECIPDSADGDRCADPSTVRRWFQRRLESILGRFPQPPTLFAWDWKAASRILIPETNSA